MKLQKAKTSTGAIVTLGSGNVFADLDLPNAEELQLKAQLIHEIRRLLERKGLTQAEVARLIGMDQPTLSKMLRGKFLSCSTERLFQSSNRLDHNIEVRIVAEEHAPDEAQTMVLVA